MCGIVGIFDYQGQKPINEALLREMNQRIQHRGPDDEGYYFNPGIGLAHRRLSIIDLNHGKQPILSHDKSLTIVFNGEIYNYQSLREELISLGYSFETQTDTEVILYSFAAWGERCLERLQGMFAFAIWNDNDKTLFLARDRVGIKPLYYSLLPSGEIIFASELKSLMLHPNFDMSLDHQGVDQYFAFGYIPDPKTIFRNTYKLAPGYFLKIKRGKAHFEPRQYWDVQFESVVQDEKVAIEQCLSVLDDVVKSHMVADVPVGAFLSGGVDSSAVVSSMSKYKQPVQTCSVAFSEKTHNESEYALKVAKQYKTDHKDYQLEPIDVDLVDQLSNIYDEPFADSSAIPTFRVCELARKQVKVVLSGDGGDETIAGYRRYRFHLHEERFKQKIPYSIRRPLFGTLASIYPKLDWAPRFLRAKATFQSLSQTTLEGYFNSIAIFKDTYRNALYTESFRQEIKDSHPISVFQSHANQFYGDSDLALVQYLDLKTYLPGDILTKVDRASMAHGLEVRVPLLDHQWIEWAAQLSNELKIHQGDGKYIFKKALTTRLPHDILYRKKQGFAVPLTKWFKEPLKDRVLQLKSSTALQQANIFNFDLIEKIVNQHVRGSHEHSAMIWSLLVFENFYQQQVISARNRYVEKSAAFT